MSRRTKVLLTGAIVALVAFVVAPWVYINVIREPAAESFLDGISPDTTVVAEPTSDTIVDGSTTTVASLLTDPSGTWVAAGGSQVGYRVDEVLFGQKVTAIGRTDAVTGSVTIEGLSVIAAEFSADMTTVRSDEPKRDAQFESRIMDVINYPVATFSLGAPIALSDASLGGTTPHLATGTLTLRGTSKPVDVNLVSSIRDGRIVIAGEVLIVFEEWGIPNPSIPGISTEDSGILEFSLVLER